MTIVFTSDHIETKKGFQVAIRFIQPGICQNDNFLCANDKCLEASYMCDGNDDCGDNSDESTICSGNINRFISLADRKNSSNSCTKMTQANFSSYCSR